MTFFFKNRDLVVPGDLLAEGNYIAGGNTYKLGNQIYANRIGLVEYSSERVSVIALEAPYYPRLGDTVVGKIVDIGIWGWRVDIKAPLLAFLKVSDAIREPFDPRMNLERIFNIGDLIIGKVVDFNKAGRPLLSTRGPDLGRIDDGLIVSITPTKIPRLIGKKGSMVNMILNESGCEMLIGQNGLVVVKGKSRREEKIVAAAIRKIEREAHTTGLTDRVFDFIRKMKERKNLG